MNTGGVSNEVQNVASGSTIDITAFDTMVSGTHTVKVKGAAAATTDTLKLNFDGAAQAATLSAYNITGATIVADEIESLSITSGGAANTGGTLRL